MPHISQPEIIARVRRYFQARLDKDAELVLDLPTDKTINISKEIEGAQAIIAQLRGELVQATFSQRVTFEARTLLNPDSNVVSVVDLEALRQAQILILRADIEHLRIFVAKLGGLYGDTAPIDPMFAGMIAIGRPAIPGETETVPQTSFTFAQVVQLYLDFKKPGWEKKTMQAVSKTLRQAMEVIGTNRHLQLIAAADVTKYRDVLARIPPNYSKMKQFQGMSLIDTADLNETGSTLSPKSQKKELDFLHAFLSWATEEGYLEKQPGSKIKVGVKKKGPLEKPRVPYTSAELKIIFASPIYTGCKSQTSRSFPGKLILKDGKYWVLLIAIYTGMRLGEIVQLLTEDVCSDVDITYFDITKREGEDKHIKTTSSYRRIPVHHRLIELGLLNHVAKAYPEGRLFPEIKPGLDGHYSHNFSKFWGRYTKQIGPLDDKTVFHSFRHNFTDALTNAGVSDAASRKLMGHSVKDVHDSYGSGPNLKVLKESIDKAQFELGF